MNNINKHIGVFKPRTKKKLHHNIKHLKHVKNKLTVNNLKNEFWQQIRHSSKNDEYIRG